MEGVHYNELKLLVYPFIMQIWLVLLNTYL
jgi:hypothetical protein